MKCRRSLPSASWTPVTSSQQHSSIADLSGWAFTWAQVSLVACPSHSSQIRLLVLSACLQMQYQQDLNRSIWTPSCSSCGALQGVGHHPTSIHLPASIQIVSSCQDYCKKVWQHLQDSTHDLSSKIKIRSILLLQIICDIEFASECWKHCAMSKSSFHRHIPAGQGDMDNLTMSAVLQSFWRCSKSLPSWQL